MIALIVVPVVLVLVLGFCRAAGKQMPTDQDVKDKEMAWHLKAFARKNP